MTSRERVRRTLEHGTPDRPPRDLWVLPGITMFRKKELGEVLRRFPTDFSGPRYTPVRGLRSQGEEAAMGKYTDAWGSTWCVAEPGIVGEVKEPALADWASMATYKLPWELIKDADMSQVNQGRAETDRFVLAATEVRPFERMQFLRGTENLFIDLAAGVKELYLLRDMIHEFNLEAMRRWAGTDVDGLSFMDDWGSQTSLLISPDLWRSFFKPMYKEYCSIAHASGKFVFFHSDGHIEAIYPDLIEIGVDAVNSQLFCMDIEKLAKSYKGKITFWGEIDRQNILPLGSAEDVRAAVRRVRHALDDGKVGVIAQCEWGIRNPRENIEAVFDEWSLPATSRG
jgi:uroporphyrinogen decarboxylase